MSSVTETKTTVEALPQELELVNWPLRDQPRCSTTIIVAAVVVAALLTIAASSLWFGMIAFAMTLLSLWRIWLPVHVTLNARGVTQRVGWHQWRTPWSQYSRVVVDDQGVTLLANSAAAPITLLRSVYIHGGPQQLQLIRVTTFYIDTHIAH
ncbi:MAG: hypothetical protein R3E01_16410 [Pirellulaceae bacterium]|nr:hypothetical protein [Planctomycetales bacterium]